MKRHRIRLSQLLSSILLWTRENLFDDDKSILIFLGFVFSRRKWGLPVFRKSSQGKLDPVASSGSHTITTLPVTSSGSNNNSGGSNNRLPAPFRKSQSDKKFKVKTTTKKTKQNKTKSKSQELTIAKVALLKIEQENDTTTSRKGENKFTKGSIKDCSGGRGRG